MSNKIQTSGMQDTTEERIAHLEQQLKKEVKLRVELDNENAKLHEDLKMAYQDKLAIYDEYQYVVSLKDERIDLLNYEMNAIADQALYYKERAERASLQYKTWMDNREGRPNWWKVSKQLNFK